MRAVASPNRCHYASFASAAMPFREEGLARAVARVVFIVMMISYIGFDQTSLLFFQECLTRSYPWLGIQGAYASSYSLSLYPSQISYVNEFRVYCPMNL